jgi:cytochrome c oxidase accessory protein FixG
MTEKPDNLIPLTDLAPREVGEIDLYQRREKIYTRRMEGFFQRVRLFTGWPLLLGYFFLPWLNWGERQAVLFDLPARQFHILGITFWPQNFNLLASLLIIGAFALFLVTNFAGRVWCGYTCPQTVWTAIFMWTEQLAEGSRNQRIKLDQAPWSTGKILRKSAKHGMWLGFALLTGATFVGYFYPIRALVPDLALGNAGFWAVAWTIFFTLATYINAGWMREQVCMYMCPYARFQSVMFDRDTLIVSYDPHRGEPRGARKRGEDKKARNLGDCIDCQLCVQVCPTGIDIRNGLQYQCITCALCIDACNSVMDKMQYPRGLIRYTTENALAGGRIRIVRPRLMGYACVLLAMIVVFSYTLISRIPLEIDIIRDRGSLYNLTREGLVANSYQLKIMNMDQVAHRYQLSVEGIDGLVVEGTTDFSVDSGEILELPLRLAVDPVQLEHGNNTVSFTVRAIDDKGIKVREDNRFIGPKGH